MNYIDYLVRSYKIVQKAHKLGKILDNFMCDKGEVLVPKEFVQALDEFNEAFTEYANMLKEKMENGNAKDN